MRLIYTFILEFDVHFRRQKESIKKNVYCVYGIVKLNPDQNMHASFAFIANVKNSGEL